MCSEALNDEEGLQQEAQVAEYICNSDILTNSKIQKKKTICSATIITHGPARILFEKLGRWSSTICVLIRCCRVLQEGTRHQRVSTSTSLSLEACHLRTGQFTTAQRVERSHGGAENKLRSCTEFARETKKSACKVHIDSLRLTITTSDVLRNFRRLEFCAYSSPHPQWFEAR